MAATLCMAALAVYYNQANPCPKKSNQTDPADTADPVCFLPITGRLQRYPRHSKSIASL